ncbi:MAG: hypothetical protein AB8G22_04515 [Saprospiraceae bacterium]
MPFLIFMLSFFFYLVTPGFYIDQIGPISNVQIVLLLLLFLNNLGKKIAILDILPIMAVLFYLMAPALNYYLVEAHWYEGYTFMPISAADYFAVAVPGTLALGMGVNFPSKIVEDHHQVLNQATLAIQNKGTLPFLLVGIGLGCFVLSPFAPSALAFVFQFGAELIMVGGLYLFFSGKNTNLALFIMSAFLIGKSVSGGMFGKLVVWAMMLTVYYFMKYQWHFLLKLVALVAGLLFIVILQSVKGDFRAVTWNEAELALIDQSKLDILIDLVEERIDSPSEFFTPLTMSYILDRFNQGYLTASAIEHTPAIEPFAEGETIFTATIGAFIPRMIWTNKPEAGGKANINRFTSLNISEGTSMNIGQLGDAYVNFGTMGGSIFMFLYGYFFKWVFDRCMQLCRQRPTIVFWLPFLFSTAIIVETDVLTTFNHLIKGLIFVWLVFKGFEWLIDKKL